MHPARYNLAYNVIGQRPISNATQPIEFGRWPSLRTNSRIRILGESGYQITTRSVSEGPHSIPTSPATTRLG
nr:hypothetical protein [Rhodopirellula bahusiensis]